jgi:hypothetical protein
MWVIDKDVLKRGGKKVWMGGEEVWELLGFVALVCIWFYF